MIGSGLEYGFTPNWSAKIEARFDRRKAGSPVPAVQGGGRLGPYLSRRNKVVGGVFFALSATVAIAAVSLDTIPRGRVR